MVSTVTVRMQCICAQTEPGESLKVSGDAEGIGSWSVPNSPCFVTEKDSFPVWALGPVELPVDKKIEFKFLIEKRDGTVLWEDFEGNRELFFSSGTCFAQYMCFHWGVPSRQTYENPPDDEGLPVEPEEKPYSCINDRQDEKHETLIFMCSPPIAPSKCRGGCTSLAVSEQMHACMETEADVTAVSPSSSSTSGMEEGSCSCSLASSSGCHGTSRKLSSSSAHRERLLIKRGGNKKRSDSTEEGGSLGGSTVGESPTVITGHYWHGGSASHRSRLSSRMSEESQMGLPPPNSPSPGTPPLPLAARFAAYPTTTSVVTLPPAPMQRDRERDVPGCVCVHMEKDKRKQTLTRCTEGEGEAGGHTTV
uniref:CBM20 domain-containing protein n=1 Tax=Chromera velia CCMP2878 TaxID=1169474 RepID=A0A0G4HJF9_9ALVE|eukprot:Cvel_28121.t1-p1 / transcript=Cvel_28121.t1 / gene=Cvel_28121 / organism=Chromera_velia_CCMP2878 / gene_product=hypothetical protein / transcript_product=hypothetical protein / location=Cvel_scaffold3624:7833-10219(+) / protein_length=363 / sequence_SO=supercontig / SO=protein_coding / is_pseudo=false